MTAVESRVFEAVEVHRDGHVVEVRLSRPELLNRVDGLLHAELIDVLTALREDPARAVILSSVGKVFSAGGDFAMMELAQRDSDVRRATVEDGRRLVRAILDLPQPLVVAMHAAAIGVGATIALLGDVLVASRRAVLADTHVGVGLVAGDGGALAWPQAGGMLRARRHLLTGDPLDAVTAHSLGMVTDLAEDADECLRIARDVAGRIAAQAPLAVRGTKQALNRISAQRAGEVLDLSLSLEEHTLASEDLLEGVAAFREGRTPDFKGR